MTHGLDRLVAYHCAPTLLGVKAGNLLSLKRKAYEADKERVTAIFGMLRGKGLDAQIFHAASGASLIYLYRRDMLLQSLLHPLSVSLLNAMGYVGQGVEELVEELKGRMENSEAFPHEIGLFLGYPPEDVWGFVKHKGSGSKLSGCWKVYADVGRAKALFRQYAYCRSTCMQCMKNGMTLDQVALAI